VTIGNAIVAYDSPQAPSVIAHEMSHLIFNEFMETARPELTWLNEGLAVCMERKSYSAEQQLAYENTCASALQYGTVPLQTLMISSPAKQERQGAQAWYCQANSVVSYLLDKGGGIGFSVLANKLKTGSSFNDAVFIAYNGQWPDLPTFERGWLATSGARPNGGPAIN
ncbi:MAG TPA: hypothetical protein PLL10_10655, partial [Elusimicrobiales bacterium]|nr:hypothetical protein [Elusimicrobiales bacterium]